MNTPPEHKLLTEEEWMLRCLVSQYDLYGDRARLNAFLRAAREQKRLLTPCSVSSHHAIYEARESSLPDYVVDEFYRLFPWNPRSEKKTSERRLLAAE